MSEPSILNPANAVTVSRYLCLPPFLYFLDRGQVQWAAITILYCGFADLIDGAVARKFNCTSAFGEMLDATTDALCYGFFIVWLSWYGRLPWQPVAIMVVLGVVNAAFRLQYARRVGRTTNFRSFAMERVVAFVVYLAGFGVTGFEPVFYTWACLVVMTVALAHDTKRMLIDPVPT